MAAPINRLEKLRRDIESKLVKLQKNIKCDLITLHLYDSEREQLYLPVGIHLLEREIFYRSVPSMERVAGKVIHKRKPIIANDAEHHPDMTGPFTHREKIKSAAGFPVSLIKTEEIVGVVFVSYRESHIFEENEVYRIEEWLHETAAFVDQALKSDDAKLLKFTLRHDAGLRQKSVRLQDILSQLRGILRSVDIALWLPQKEEKKLELSASAGISLDLFETVEVEISHENSNTIAGVFYNGKDSVVENYQERSEQIFGLNIRTPWEKMYLFPIRSEYHTLGVLSVFRRDTFGFTDHDLDAITAFIKLLAVTIENEERIITLNALHDLGVRLTLSLNLKEILDEVVRNTCQIIGADISTLHLYDPTSQHFLELEKAAVFPESARKHMERPQSSGGLTSEILKKRRIYVEDIDANKDLSTSTFIKKESIKAYVGTPLISNGDALGVLYVNFKYPRRFSPEELSLIQIMANYASTAVRRAQLANQQIAVAKIAQDIVSNLAINDILQTILDRTLELLHCQEGAIALYDDVAKELEFRYARGKKLSRRLKLGMGLMGAVALSKKPLRIADVTKDGRYVAHVKRTMSELDVPLLIGSDLVGVLNIESPRLDAFSLEDENLAMTLAGQAAIAIANARLFESAKIRAEALKSLHDVASELISITNTSNSLEKILTQIAENAQKVLTADLVDIYQYQEVEDRFILPPIKVGDRREPNVVKDRVYKDDVLYTIVGKKEPHYVQNAQNSQYGLVGVFSVERDNIPRERFVVRERILSSASIPMVVENEVVGVLFVNYRSPQTFSSQQTELIELFSNQAAIAIRNSRLFQESLLRSERLNLVQEVASTVSWVTDIDQILQLVVDGLAKVFGVRQSAVALFDEKREFAVIQKEYLESGYVSALGDKHPIKDNPQIEKLLETKKVIIIDDVQHDPIMAKTRDILIKRRTLSLMVVPIVIDGEVVGSIGVDAVDKKRHFTVEEAELAQAIADQAAAAIRISQQLKNRLNDIKALQDIIEEMHLGELDAVLTLIAERAIALTRAKHGGVWLVNKNRTALDFGGVASKEQSEQTPPDISLNPDGETSFSKLVVHNKRSYLSGNVRTDENYKPWYGDTVSELTVPIIYHERVIGTINVESPKENNFTEDHKYLLEAMAGQAAVAIQIARLITRMEIVDSIGRELTSGIRLRENEILDLIYQRASQLMDTGNMYIALYDDVTKMIRFDLMYVDGKENKLPARRLGEAGMGKTEWIIQNRQPIFHATKAEAEAWYAQPGHQEFVGNPLPSWMGVSMQVGERVLGVIATYHPTQEYLYGQDELDVLTAMAGQAAIAIDNARLYYDINHNLETLVTFAEEVTSSINLTENEIIEKIYQQASRLMDTNNMYIALYDDVTKMISFDLMYVNGEGFEQAPRKLEEGKTGKTEWIIQNRQPIFHATKAEAEAWYAQPGHQEFVGNPLAAWIGVPMQVGERVLGVIATYHPTQEYLYTDRDQTILEGIARVASIALENTQLYKEARGEAIAAKQLSTLGTAVAALQHRINNTFNIIIPNVTRLRSRVNLNDPQVVEILDIIERNARYTSSIIARIQEPLKEVEATIINLNAILGDLVLSKHELWKSSATTPFVQIEFEADDTIPNFWGPSGQIAEVFDNLLSNAHKAMPKGGEVRITSKLNSDKIEVRVKDTGMGISQEIQTRLFVKPVPSREPGGGSGLGLWLSRLMLQSIGGNVMIESSDQTGTTMLVMIPVYQGKKES